VEVRGEQLGGLQPDVLVRGEAVQQHDGRPLAAFVVDPVRIAGLHRMFLQVRRHRLARDVRLQQPLRREQVAAAQHDGQQRSQPAQEFQPAQQHAFPERSSGVR
jgi:hypothetical protein